MSRDAERAGQELGRAIAEALNRVPRIYPRCEVVSTDDLADGWVVCLVGRHNRQRVTYSGGFAVEVGDFLDAAWVPGCGFVALGVPNLTAITDLGLASAVELTIAGGTVIPTRVYHSVDTEGDAASDDLDTITAGDEGDILVIRAENDARTVVVKHGMGNIYVLGESDISLDSDKKHLVLICDGANWAVIGDGGGGGGASQLSDLSDVTTVSYTDGYILAADGTDFDAKSPNDAGIALLEQLKHYRKGVLPIYIDSDKIRVSAGIIEINGEIMEEAEDSAILDTDTAGDYISGMSEKATDTWLYIYVSSDGAGGWMAKFSDDPPLFAKAEEAFTFTAQISVGPTSGDTTIDYNNSVGNLYPGDIVRCWSDADYTVVRCAWTVASDDTAGTPITVQTNNNWAALNEYLTVAPGPPRYRDFSGTWWRCVGTVRLDGSQEILPFTKGHDGLVLYNQRSPRLLENGSQTSWTPVGCGKYIPPISTRGVFFLWLDNPSGTNANFLIRGLLPALDTFFAVSGSYDTTTQSECTTDPSQTIEYKMSGAATADGNLNVLGYLEDL